MEKIRSCPICPKCGSKKFDRISSTDVVIKCITCNHEMRI